MNEILLIDSALASIGLCQWAVGLLAAFGCGYFYGKCKGLENGKKD